MRLVRHLGDLPYEELANGSVVTIGAYDGLHLGHEQLLERVLREARSSGRPAVVMSFEPTPKEFFSAERPPARLMRFREKYEALAAHGIERNGASWESYVSDPGDVPEKDLLTYVYYPIRPAR